MISQLRHVAATIKHLRHPLHLASETFCDHRRPSRIDRTLVPELDERDIQEQFVHGSGPGGQNVNKASNCVVIRHVPTGITFKCHESRLLHVNRQLARESMRLRLDTMINGEASVAAQQRRLNEQRSRERTRRSKLRQEMKRTFKERENLNRP